MSRLPASASRSTITSQGDPGETIVQAHGFKLDEAAANRRLLNPAAKEFVPGEEASGSNASSSVSNEPATSSRVSTDARNQAGVSGALKGAQNGKGGVKITGPGRHSSADNGSSAVSSSRRGQGNHTHRFRHDRPPPRTQRRPYRRHAYDKDLFLQANFRFLVSDYGDYGENTTDPDKMLDWEDIAVVELSAAAPVQCPICLDDRPLCPQITSCGHVFCFPCILRYMMIEDGVQRTENWKKCPLCFTLTSCKDLRTAVIHDVRRYDVGDEIEFTLLTRAKGFIIPLRNNESYLGSLAYSKDGRCDLFSKFTLTSSIEQPIDRAVAELTTWAEAAQFGGTEDLERLPYVFASIDQLKLRKVAWDEHRSLELVSTSPPQRTRIMAQARVGTGEHAGKQQNNEKNEVKTRTPKKEPIYRVSAFSDEPEPVDPVESVQVYGQEDASESGRAKHEDFSRHEEIGTYSFYQAADGQLVILHPVNVKCLLHHFGSYQNFPSSLRGKICEIESITQTEASRRRYKYLSHLPLTSIFQLCEVDLSKVLPASAFAPFSEELVAREKRRRRKVARDKQIKAAEEREEAASMPPSPADFLAIMNVLHDQEVPTSVDFPEALVSAVPIAVSPPVEQRKLFSSVAKLGFASGHDAPELGKSSSSKPAPAETPGSSGNPLSFAAIIQKEKKVVEDDINRGSAKGKKPARVLLSTAGGRRY